MTLKWSFSQSRTFGKCPRQWFFATQFAKWNARDPLSRESFLLSKLQSVSAWRGSLVDSIICDEVVPALRRRAALDRGRIIALAEERFQKQLTFAREKRWREPGMSAAQQDHSYAALYGIEYGQDIEAELATAWVEVEQALTTFLEMGDLLQMLRGAHKLIPQRTLRFRHSKCWVIARPDLIAFFRNSVPLLVDWKVHIFGAKDYRLQLALYALALTRCRPHVDFPVAVGKYRPHEIRLLEAQLLTGKLREYHLSADDVEKAENHISVTARQMWLSIRGSQVRPVSYHDMPVTVNGENCQRCPFRCICWEDVRIGKESICQDLRQTSLLF